MVIVAIEIHTPPLNRHNVIVHIQYSVSLSYHSRLYTGNRRPDSEGLTSDKLRRSRRQGISQQTFLFLFFGRGREDLNRIQICLWTKHKKAQRKSFEIIDITLLLLKLSIHLEFII